MSTVVAVLVATVAISACWPVGESSSSAESVDRAGATLVHNDEAIWGEDDAWLVSPEPQVTIGQLDGPAEYQFSRISAAARQSDGDIVVADRGTDEVRLYRHDATFVRTLGGPGSGPGEFRDPAQVVVTTADSVLVWDNVSYRASRFDSAGEFVAAQSVDRAGIAKAVDPPLYPGTAQLLQDDLILVRLIEKTGKGFQSGVSRARSGALRVTTDLSRIDTLMFFEDVEQMAVEAPWGQWLVAPPLAKRTLTTVQATSPKVCIGDQEGPEIVCFGPDTSRTVIRWNSEPTPVTAQEIATWRDTTVEMYTQKMSEHDALQMLDQVTVPTVRPPYLGLVLDRVGNLWVERGPSHRTASRSVDHLVFDQVGALLGMIALPPIEVLEIGDDYVMGVFRDELDVEYLQVYGIVKR